MRFLNGVLSIQIFILFTACFPEKDVKKKPVILNPSFVKEVSNSSFMGDFSVIPLKTDILNQIGSIDHLLYNEGRYYVLDRDNSQTLFVFSEEGELLYSIDTKGRGPGEFLDPSHFDIISDKDEVFIFDPGNKKIIFYDLNTGDYKREKVIKYNPEIVRRLGDFYVLVMSNENAGLKDRLIFLDKDLELVDSFLPIDNRLLNFNVELPNSVSSYKKNLFFTLPNEYAVYKVTEEQEFEKFLTFDAKENALPDNFYENNISVLERFKRSVNSVNHISGFVKHPDFYFLTYRYNRENYYTFVNNSGERLDMKYDSIIDDLGTGPTSNWPVGSHENSIYWFSSEDNLNTFLENNKSIDDPDSGKQFEQKYEHLIELSKQMLSDEQIYLYLIKTDIEF